MYVFTFPLFCVMQTEKKRTNYILTSLARVTSNTLQATLGGAAYSEIVAVQADLDLPLPKVNMLITRSASIASALVQAGKQPVKTLPNPTSLTLSQRRTAREHAFLGAQLVLTDGVHISLRHKMQRKVTHVEPVLDILP